MKYLCVVVFVLSTVLGSAWASEDLKFPPGFKFGVASSSYQIEGAWNVSDKSESVWDRFTHSYPERILGQGSADVACDSYHLWKRDIQMIEELGAHFYRFSISWSRLLPTGFPDYISEDGKNYYSNLIDALLEKGIEPVVTIYHWDMPQRLQNYGGWNNPLIADWFAAYARVVFSLYGDRVKIWLTINEPLIFCDFGHSSEMMAPGIEDPDVSPYLCAKHSLIAHAKAWRIYDKEFKDKYHGQVAINNQLVWFQPKTDDDKELTDLLLEYAAGRYSHPIYSKEGGWPPTLEKAMEEMRLKKGRYHSKLPPFTKEEIELVKGTYDFYAMNHYTSRVVRRPLPNEEFSLWPLYDCPDLEAKVEKPEEWLLEDGSDWFWMYPEGIRKQLVWLKEKYGDIQIRIMENGYASKQGLNDMKRVDYYQDYLKQVLLAIKEDGVNVTSYTAWTLMDNFEWGSGYETKFGLYEVDFTSPERTRTPRISAKFYAKVIKNHSLLPNARDEL